MVVQWLGLSAHSVGGLGSIPGQGTRPCMLKLRPSTAKYIKKKKKKKPSSWHFPNCQNSSLICVFQLLARFPFLVASEALGNEREIIFM